MKNRKDTIAGVSFYDNEVRLERRGRWKKRKDEELQEKKMANAKEGRDHGRAVPSVSGEAFRIFRANWRRKKKGKGSWGGSGGRGETILVFD